ncbi:SurA N-terminal domain-containing protein [Candidatus Kaiserbacteria bacterium]|nr:MAG: SurA N-terminal domain-containing protein [Candidatus Kaiserbacteria bacterium]
MDNTPETTNAERPTTSEPVKSGTCTVCNASPIQNGICTVCAAEHTPVTSETPASVCGTGFDTPCEPFYKKYATYIALIVATAIILGAGFYMYSGFGARGAVVATVNGTKIYQPELDESINLLSQSAAAQGANISDPKTLEEIRTQALEVLISNTLMTAAAKKEGVTVSDADVQKQFDDLLAQFGTQEELTAKMAEVGLTEEKLRKNISDRILAERYIEAVTDIETVAVTEEEVAEFIKTITANGTELPPLDEIRPQIEAQLAGEKQQKIITELVEKLRADADVVIK